jgi:hypothetical protein
MPGRRFFPGKQGDIEFAQRRARKLAGVETEHGVPIMQRSELRAVRFVRSGTMIQHVSGEGSFSDGFAYPPPGIPVRPRVFLAADKPVNGLSDRKRTFWVGIDHRTSSRMSGERKEASGLPRLSACRAYPCALTIVLCLTQRHYVLHGPTAFDNGDHVRAPSLQRCAFLRCKVMPLVDADNSRPAARDVVQDLLRHFEANP